MTKPLKPFRMLMSHQGEKNLWFFLVDEGMSCYVPVLALPLQFNVLSGLRNGTIAPFECGIYTSMIHTWMSFDITPVSIDVVIAEDEQNKCGASSRTYVALKQENELGKAIGRVELSLSDAVIFSEMLDTPIGMSEDSIQCLSLAVGKGEDVVDQIMKSVASFESEPENPS